MSTPHQGETRAGGDAPPKQGNAHNLVLRIASALVLGPIALGAAYLGGWFFFLLCAVAACGIFWEWTRLASGYSDPRVLAPGLVVLAAVFACVGANATRAAFAVLAAGAVVTGLVAAPRRADAVRSSTVGLWAAGGLIYAGIAFLGPALLRRDAERGLTAIFFLAATVWMTDIFAYFVGRAVGGPLLFPRISPKKTWSGAVGGLAGGVAAGVLVAYASSVRELALVGVIAVVLSILAQAGDLLESAVKRRFGAKDASALIPGHGGLMDRLDGFLVAALAALLIGIARQGTDAPAQGLLGW